MVPAEVWDKGRAEVWEQGEEEVLAWDPEMEGVEAKVGAVEEDENFWRNARKRKDEHN